ncbi:hypothetical protein J4Q44_G00338470 [Coregonus suidteri]|uniref:Uncharacterized protein n=1 Tax=Coregonus suidteri TaxID=861788 RepID=A0AAN8Q973_9TELE
MKRPQTFSATIKKTKQLPKSRALETAHSMSCGNCALRDGWLSPLFSCSPARRAGASLQPPAGPQTVGRWRAMTHMPMLFHLRQLSQHGNTIPEKADRTRMGGQGNIYPLHTPPSQCLLIKRHDQFRFSAAAADKRSVANEASACSQTECSTHVEEK